MDRGFGILQAAITAVMAVATVLLGITIPALWAMSADIGALKTSASESLRRFDSVDRQLESIRGDLNKTSREVESINIRLTQRDQDPNTLLSQIGLKPLSEFAAARVGNKFVIFPKSDAAAAELASGGLVREAIAPTIHGYVGGEYDATGSVRLIAPANMPSQSR